MIILGNLEGSYAQEALVPAVRYGGTGSLKSAQVDVFPDTVELPFFDDFSGRSHRPDPGHWTDDYAYVNNSYSGDPVTIGVATLDAVDA